MGKVKGSKMFSDSEEQERKFQESLDEYTDDFFGDDTSENLEIDNNNVERVLYRHSKIERDLDEMTKRRQSSCNFYDDEINKIKKKLDYQSHCLKSFLKVNKKKTMKFPNGTISIRKTTKHSFNGDDETLLAWCKKQKRNLTTTTTKPSKSLIIKYIKDTGFAPDDWEIDENESFNVKTKGE